MNNLKIYSYWGLVLTIFHNKIFNKEEPRIRSHNKFQKDIDDDDEDDEPIIPKKVQIFLWISGCGFSIFIVKLIYDKSKNPVKSYKPSIETPPEFNIKYIKNLIKQKDAGEFCQFVLKELNKYMAGQDEVKKSMILAFYDHYYNLINNPSDFKKKNILLIGPSGSGKNTIITNLCNILQLPLFTYDCSKVTSAGYIGNNTNEIKKDFNRMFEFSPEAAKYAVIYLDELDKKRIRKDENRNSSHDSEKVQGELLSILEDTSDFNNLLNNNVLCIGGGAFIGLDEIKKKRIEGKTDDDTKKDGQDSFQIKKQNSSKTPNKDKDQEIIKNINIDDLTAYGFIPELSNRFNKIMELEKLTENEISTFLKEKIKNEPKSFLLNKKLYSIKLDEDALNFIIKLSTKERGGMRRVYNLLDEAFDKKRQEIIFNNSVANETDIKISVNEVKKYFIEESSKKNNI